MDFRELKLIYAAAEGDGWRVNTATPGKAGDDGHGKGNTAKPGRDIAFTAGRNTIISPDGRKSPQPCRCSPS